MTASRTRVRCDGAGRLGCAEGARRSRKAAIFVHGARAPVQIIDGTARPVRDRARAEEGIPGEARCIIRSLIPFRDAVREVLRSARNDEPAGDRRRSGCASAYALFVRNFGPINLTTISETEAAEGEMRETFRRPNLQPFLDDPDVWLVASIEDYDLESGTAKHGPIFRRARAPPETRP